LDPGSDASSSAAEHEDAGSGGAPRDASAIDRDVGGGDGAAHVDGSAAGSNDARAPLSDASSDTGPGDGAATTVGDASDASTLTGDDPCTGPDTGNSDPAHAANYVLGTTFHGCIRGYSSVNYIQFTTPPNPAGGYVVVSFTDVGSTALDTYLFVASNTNPGYSICNLFASHDGDSLTFWFGAAPSTSYVLEVEDLFGMAAIQAPYTMTATFTASVDPNKPNSSKATATPIQLGTPVQDIAFHGYTSDSTTDPGWWNFYQVTLAAAPATVTVTNVPAEIYLDVYVYGDTDIEGFGESMSAGASFTFMASPVAGLHYIQVEPAFNPNPFGSGSTPASYVVSPYTFVITQ
jgi:hypothetical protein